MIVFTEDQLAHQEQLIQFLKLVLQGKGHISFAEFMEIVLYAPGLGYYSAGMQKFGETGDFVTAPLISPLFSACLANQYVQIFKNIENPSILELGAGNGLMAAQSMLQLGQQDHLPEKYYILERSGDLRERQQTTIYHHCPQYFERFAWLNNLDDLKLNGIIVGNEVLDALPVHLFQIGENNTILEAYIQLEAKQFRLIFEKASAPVEEYVQALQANHHLPVGYTSEVNLMQKPLLASLNPILQQGMMLWIDYGFTQNEYYHPERSMGTLMCHCQHLTHSDPMVNIGLQDITSHVDFTALAQAALNMGLNISGFTTQGNFLLANGLLDLATHSKQNPYQLSQQIQVLTQPHEMGELFKVIAFNKGLEIPLQGFAMRNFPVI